MLSPSSTRLRMDSIMGIFLVVFVIITVLLVDMEVTNLSDIISKRWITSTAGIVVFVVISSTYLVGQFFILQFVEQKSKEMGKRSGSKRTYFNTINTCVRFVYYFLIAIFIIIILDVVIESHYYAAMLIVVTTVSYGLAGVMMGLLARRFFSWYRLNRNSIVVLLYGLSAATVAVYSAAALVYFDTILLDKPAVITPNSKVEFTTFEPGTAMSILNYIYYYVAIASFILIWAGTAMLLHNYSKSLGRVRYWGIMIAPLAFFLGQIFVTLFVVTQFSTELSKTDQTSFIFYYAIVFTLSSTVGGILFGVPFWILAKSKSVSSDDSNYNNNRIGDYLTISAIGIVLLFVSGSANVAHAPFPPFGLATVSLIGISTYFILVGFYSSAVSVSEDIGLRQSIRKSVLREAKLLESIGSAEMEQEIQRRVMKIAIDDKDIMQQETGVEPSLSEDEMKSYLNEVIEEVKTMKKNNIGKDNQTE